MTIVWPHKVLWPRRGAFFNMASRSLRGAATIAGSSQVVASSAGVWKCTLESLELLTADQIVCFRAVAAILEGQLNSVVVPLWPFEVQKGLQPVPDGAVAAGLYGDKSVPHSDGSFFSDGTGYGSPRVIDVQLTASMIAGATTGSVAITNAGLIQPGQHFSIGERLYRLKNVTYLTSTTASISFQPPLREAASIGENLEFDRAACRMRLASDSEMDMTIEPPVFAFPTVNLIEDV